MLSNNTNISRVLSTFKCLFLQDLLQNQVIMLQLISCAKFKIDVATATSKAVFYDCIELSEHQCSSCLSLSLSPAQISHTMSKLYSKCNQRAHPSQLWLIFALNVFFQ